MKTAEMSKREKKQLIKSLYSQEGISVDKIDNVEFTVITKFIARVTEEQQKEIERLKEEKDKIHQVHSETAGFLKSQAQLLKSCKETLSKLVDPVTGKVWVEIEKSLRKGDRDAIEQTLSKLS